MGRTSARSSERWKRAATFAASVATFIGVQLAWPNLLSNMDGKPLSEGRPPVVTCDSDLVTSTYDVTYDSQIRDFVVSSITLSSLDDAGCEGMRVAAVLLSRTSDVLDETSGLDAIGAAATQVLGLSHGTALARDADRVVITIYRAS